MRFPRAERQLNAVLSVVEQHTGQGNMTGKVERGLVMVNLPRGAQPDIVAIEKGLGFVTWQGGDTLYIDVNNRTAPAPQRTITRSQYREEPTKPQEKKSSGSRWSAIFKEPGRVVPFGED